MNELCDKKIIDSWQKNVEPWSKAISDNQIESRIQVTNGAIIDAIKYTDAKTVLDIGCGEGWLTHALSELHYNVLGIDGVSGLIEKAKARHTGQFQTLKYEDLSSQSIAKQFDLAVCNFSLLGKESVEHLFKVIPSLLTEHGVFIIQTLHPYAAMVDDYKDGWRKGSWQGFNDDFTDPAPWYYRTTATWINLFITNGFSIHSVKETINPTNNQLASLIVTANKI